MHISHGLYDMPKQRYLIMFYHCSKIAYGPLAFLLAAKPEHGPDVETITSQCEPAMEERTILSLM